jgi:hypothetical protein
MAIAELLSRIAAELALFAGVGFLLFAVNDVLVDLIYFGRSIGRSLAIYTRYPRAFASEMPSARFMPWQFAMDAYLQGGVVGHDGFVDGGMTMTRPVIRRISAGFRVWGGMQPGVSRLDVGPRISVKVRDNMRVHLDWRQRVAGKCPARLGRLGHAGRRLLKLALHPLPSPREGLGWALAEAPLCG